MPVNTVSETLSTGIYFAAMLGLLVVMIGPAASDYQAASLASAKETAAAVASQIDSMSPGMQSVLKLSSSPGTSVSVSFSGSVVTAKVDGASASAQLRWSVDAPVLAGGRSYDMSFSGGSVTLA